MQAKEGSPRREERRGARGRAAGIAVALALVAVVAVPASAHLITRQPGRDPGDVNPHDLPPYGGTPSPERAVGDHTADSCTGKAQPGTVRLLKFIDHWFRGQSAGIYNCRNIAGTNTLSIHAEGRALDWKLDSGVPKQLRAAKRIRRFFLYTDLKGKRWAMARRFGIQQIIYNGHHWSTTHEGSGWHDCEWDCGHEGHMHIEQRWKGAKKKTSAYTGYETTHEGPHPLRSERRDQRR
jgi:hypothetical protein